LPKILYKFHFIHKICIQKEWTKGAFKIEKWRFFCSDLESRMRAGLPCGRVNRLRVAAPKLPHPSALHGQFWLKI